MNQQRIRRLLQHFMLLGISGINAAAKLALAIYAARFLGLAELGIYGLITGATTIVPAVFGFGLTDWIGRQVVGLKASQAIPYITSRLGVSLAMHVIVQPTIWLVNFLLGEPLPWTGLLLIGSILLLEHLGSDAHDMLVLRGRVYLAYILTFIHTGIWPLVVIAWGLIDPSARTLEHLLMGWLGGLIVTWIILCALLVWHQHWRLMRPQLRWLMGCFRPSLPFYLKDISNVGGLFADRYLISIFLGLELTGVYTFFWSVANAVHTLVFYGTVQPNIAEIVTAGRSSDASLMRHLRHRLHIETGSWAILLALSAATAVAVVLPYIGRPLLSANLPIFAMLLFATLLRVGADGYSIVLLGLHRDRAIAVIGILGAIMSILLNVTLIPIGGLYGAATACVLTAAALLTARVYISLSPTAFRHSQ